VNACEVKAHLIGCWQNLGAVCFWQLIPSGLNLVVVAVLRDSLCVVSLLPCMADCCMLYTVCKLEQFVLTTIERRLLLLLLLSHSATELSSFLFSFVDFKQVSFEICYCQADINLSAYRKHVQSQNAPKPLTFAEEELEEIKRKEVTLLFY